MIRRLIAVAGLLMVFSLANAQSSVTLYGVIDIGPAYRTHVNAAGDHTFSLGDSSAIGDGGNGALVGSRFGIKGTEDLGGGTSALFQLENGFTANSGTAAQQGQLFGRQAFVGLEDTTLGKLTMGRQYGLGTNLLFTYDPLGWGDVIANEWEAYLVGVRFDNSIRYTKVFAPITLEVQYTLGGQAGDINEGKAIAADLRYLNGGLNIAGLAQEASDAHDHNAMAFSFDSNYTFDADTLILNYVTTNYDPGFARSPNLSGLPLANTGFISNGSNTLKRTDHLWTLGNKYNISPSVLFTLGYMHDNITNASAAGNGMLSTFYAVLSKALSKRTDVYVAADYSRAGGQADVKGVTTNGIGDGVPGTTSNSTGVAFDIRVRF